MKIIDRKDRLCYNENYCEVRDCGECEYHWDSDEEIEEEEEN